MKAKNLVIHLTILMIAILASIMDNIILLMIAFAMSWLMAFQFNRMIEFMIKETKEYYRTKINDGK